MQSAHSLFLVKNAYSFWRNHNYVNSFDAGFSVTVDPIH